MQAHQAPSLEHSVPGDLIELVAGSASATLSGFSDRTATRGSLTHPATPFIPARQFDRAVPVIGRSAKTWRWLVLGLTGLGIFSLAMGLGVLVALALVRWETTAAETLPAWKLVKVVDQGVMVSMGGREDLIPIGGKVPNGDVVVSVFPNRNVVVLDSATVMLRTPDLSMERSK